jgi:predicted MFS family arabinose efflux permease
MAVSLAKNTIRRVIGATVPAAVARSLASIGVNFAALSVFTTFFGPWFIGDAGASIRQASITYLAAGLCGVIGGYLGGHLTDRYGPRLIVMAGTTLQVVFVAIMLVPGTGVVTGMVSLIVVTFLQPVRGVAQRVALAQVGSPDDVEHRFAGYRLVINLGAFAGPLLAAGCVVIGWWAVHLEVVVLFVGSLLLATRLPRRAAGHATRERGAAVWRDGRLYGLIVATTAAWTIAFTYESVLPIILTQSYGYSPSTWALVYSLGPILIIVFQFRVMRWLSGRSFVARLTAGTLLMGAVFPLLIVSRSLWILLLVVCVFLVGDMVWGPASEYAPLRIAPQAQQGTYVGVLTSSIWLGSALAPAIELPVSDRYGDTVLWILVFVIGAFAAIVYRLTAGLARMTSAAISS